MWKSLREYYNKDTKQYVFPREVYLKNKEIIRKDLKTGKFENRYDSETQTYTIYKTVVGIA